MATALDIIIKLLCVSPQVCIKSLDSDNHYPTLDWQRAASRCMVEQFLNLPIWIQVRVGGGVIVNRQCLFNPWLRMTEYL